MDDDRIWTFEESLWTGDAAHYRELIDPDCVMILPHTPHVLTGEAAVAAVADTPRWSSVIFSDQRVARPQEGLITIAYKVDAKRNGEADYTAWCTTTMHRLEHDVWRVVQHQQTPPLAAAGHAGA